MSDVTAKAEKPKKRDVALTMPGFLRWFTYFFVQNGCWLVCKILFRYSVVGAEKIPLTGPVVLVANHASFIDPIFLSICTKRWVQYLMYSTFYYSIARPVFAYFCCVPVDETRFVDAIKTGSRLLERGACVGIFPEGAVSYDGKLLPAKPGALFLAQRSGAAVIPVTLVGNHDALPRGGWMPRLKKVTLIVGEPRTIAETASREDVARMLDEIMREFAGNLGQAWPPKEPVVFPPEVPPVVRYY